MSDTSLPSLADDHKLDQDHARDRNQKRKWALGETTPTTSHPSPRPVKPYNQANGARIRREVQFQQAKAAHSLRMSRKYVTTDISDSSASDEDVKEASAAPEPDAGYTYSYDKATGPSRGSQILGQAIAKAEERFETKEMEKLVSNEYEVVAEGEEGDGGEGYLGDEEGFELV